MIKFDEQELIRVFVRGRAHAQTRARHTKNGVYSDASKMLIKWKKDLVDEIRAAMRIKMMSKIDGAICVDMVFLLPVKKKQLHNTVCHTKPDKDNLEKAVLDCMQAAGVFAVGDGQVGVGQTAKVWCKPGEEGVWLRVSRVRVSQQGEKRKAPHGALNAKVEWLA